MGIRFEMEQPAQVAQTQEAAPVAALPTPSQGKKSCKTFKKVENLPANRGPRKPCKSLLKRKKRTCAPRRRKKSWRKASRKCAKQTSRRRRKRSSRKRKAKKSCRRRRKAKKAKKSKKRCASRRRRVVRRKARKAC